MEILHMEEALGMISRRSSTTCARHVWQGKLCWMYLEICISLVTSTTSWAIFG